MHMTPNSKDIRLAFLIETHVDFSRLYLWTGYKRSLLRDGDLPLFKELASLFTSACNKVDFLIIAMCTQNHDEIVDAVILNCASIRCSASRQKMTPVEYVGYSRNSANLMLEDGKKAASHLEVVRVDDGIQLVPVLDEGERRIEAEVFARDLEGFHRAMGLQKDRDPFLATFGVEMLIELYGDYAARDWARTSHFGVNDLYRWNHEMGYEELRERMSSFELAHGFRH